MKVQFHSLRKKFQLPKEPPAWAKQVPRWYQLDAYAFLLAELFYDSIPNFEHLVLSSPGASNETDFHFAHSGAESAQKFVHTLPNIRAAMALQSIEKVAQFTCLQAGDQSITEGLTEFIALCEDGIPTAWASVHSLPNDNTSQDWTCYEAVLISKDENGPWSLYRSGGNTTKSNDLEIIGTFDNNRSAIKIGPFTLEK